MNPTLISVSSGFPICHSGAYCGLNYLLFSSPSYHLLVNTLYHWQRWALYNAHYCVTLFVVGVLQFWR